MENEVVTGSIVWPALNGIPFNCPKAHLAKSTWGNNAKSAKLSLLPKNCTNKCLIKDLNYYIESFGKLAKKEIYKLLTNKILIGFNLYLILQ